MYVICGDLKAKSLINKLVTGSIKSWKQATLLRIEKKCFINLKPLRFYTAVTKTQDKKISKFSIRFLGQIVAELQVDSNKKVNLIINSDRSKKNDYYFSLPIKAGKYDWNSEVAKKFRDHFKNPFEEIVKIKPRFPEHQVESAFLKEMEKRTKSNKFKKLLSGIQPITIQGFPLQMPLPISAHTGDISEESGHIDILARRRLKGKVRLSVWELKKPKNIDNAVRQVFIYTASLIYLLRSECGNKWYNAFGFKGPLPIQLKVEAVIAVSNCQRQKLSQEVKIFSPNSNPIEIENDLITLSAAYYNPTTYEIEDFQTFQKF